jgi:DNA-dependent protein kinase catalytic subunit
MYPKLALMALNALEKWLTTQRDPIRQYLPAILPCLRPYLVTPSQEDLMNPFPKLAPAAKSKTKSPYKPSKVHGATPKHDLKALRELQYRILRLLGSLDGQHRRLVMANASDSVSAELPTSANAVIMFDIPLQNSKATIALDGLLGRVFELAMSSTSQQTRTAACEFVHSVVIYVVGKDATSPDKDARFAMLYEYIFPRLLQLAACNDMIAGQLFSPLVLQLIRWYTRSAKPEDLRTMALLQSIFASVSSPHDAKLREFSTACLAEFFKWSIKNVAATQGGGDSPTNIRSMLRRLYVLLRHPKTYERLGALLTLKQALSLPHSVAIVKLGGWQQDGGGRALGGLRGRW